MNIEIPNKFYRVAAKALIFNEEKKLLLLKETNDKGWELPGGGIEYGDSPHATITRELEEEMGCVVDTIEASPSMVLFGQIELPHPDTWVLQLGYKTTLKELHFTPSDEAEEFGFFSAEEMKKLKMRSIQNLAEEFAKYSGR